VEPRFAERNRWQLTLEEREAYLEAGFFVRPAVFTPAEIETLQDAAERAVGVAQMALAQFQTDYCIDGHRYVETAGTTIQLEHEPGSKTLRVLEPFHHLDPRFAALIDAPHFVEPVRALLGCAEVALFTDKLNLKRPREGSRFCWHQDSPYWVFACSHVDRLVNVMLSLDAASASNGCLRVVPGSHRRGILPGLSGHETLAPLFTDPRSFDEASQVPIEVPAGSLLFFSPHAVHGSEPNLSSAPRRALLFTYQPAGHTMFKRPGERRAIVSGEAGCS